MQFQLTLARNTIFLLTNVMKYTMSLHNDILPLTTYKRTKIEIAVSTQI